MFRSYIQALSLSPFKYSFLPQSTWVSILHFFPPSFLPRTKMKPPPSSPQQPCGPCTLPRFPTFLWSLFYSFLPPSPQLGPCLPFNYVHFLIRTLLPSPRRHLICYSISQYICRAGYLHLPLLSLALCQQAPRARAYSQRLSVHAQLCHWPLPWPEVAQSLHSPKSISSSVKRG